MELQKKHEELCQAFEAFKKNNDQRLDEIKKNGVESAAIQEKMAKNEKHIADLEAKIGELNAAITRAAQGGGNQETEEQKKMKDYKNAGLLYLRKGRELSSEHQEFAKKAMSVDSDADGGFFVTPEMSSVIEKKIFESTPMRQLASVLTISTDSYEFLYDIGEVASGWVGETSPRPATATSQLKKVTIPIHELYAFPFATQKLLDDAAFNLEAWLGEKVNEKFGRDEATAFISGNGVHKPKGILDYANGTTGFNDIQRVLTATNSAIAGDDLISIQSNLKEAYQNNASWLINRLLIGVIRKLKDTVTGQYLWQPGLMASQPNMLLGRPVYMAADLPSAFAATTDLLIYGDIKAGYQIVDRIGIRVLRDALTAKPYVGFYTTKRVGGGVKNFDAIKVLKGNT